MEEKDEVMTFIDGEDHLQDAASKEGVSTCCSGKVYDPSGEGVKGICNSCGEPCGIV